jgi:hypothetical protein
MAIKTAKELPATNRQGVAQGIFSRRTHSNQALTMASARPPSTRPSLAAAGRSFRSRGIDSARALCRSMRCASRRGRA